MSEDLSRKIQKWLDGALAKSGERDVCQVEIIIKNVADCAAFSGEVKNALQAVLSEKGGQQVGFAGGPQNGLTCTEWWLIRKRSKEHAG